MTNPRAPKGLIRVRCPFQNEVWTDPALASVVGQETRVVVDFDMARLVGRVRITGIWQDSEGLLIDLMVLAERTEGAVAEYLGDGVPLVGMGYELVRGRASKDTDPPTRIVDAASILALTRRPAESVEVSFPEEWKAKPVTLEPDPALALAAAPEDEWKVYLTDEHGFVLSDPEILLEHLGDDEWIWEEYGECIPEAIEVVRRSALPKPQSPGSETLRAPGGWTTMDKFEFEVADWEPEHALLAWRGAHGFAAALNTAPGPA